MFIATESKLEKEVSNAEDRFINAFLFEASDDSDNYYDDEKKENNFKKLMEKVAEFIKSVAQAVKKFFEEMNLKFKTKVEQMRVQQRLKVYKALWSNAAVKKALDGKVDYFDIAKLESEYTKFINDLVKEQKQILNTEFKSHSDYMDAVNKVDDMLNNKYEKLSDEDMYMLTGAVHDVMEYTEKESKNFDKYNRSIFDKFNEASAELFNTFKNMKVTKEEESVTKAKAQHINSIISGMSSKLKSIVAMIRTAIMQAVSALNSLFSKFVKTKENGDVEPKEEVVKEATEQTQYLEDIIAEKKFNLMIESAEHELKMSEDMVEIMILEASDDDSDDEKRENIFKTILDKLIEYIDELVDKFTEMFNKMVTDLKAKLISDELEKQLAEYKTLIQNKEVSDKLKDNEFTISLFDEYVDRSEDLINQYTNAVNKILSTKYTDNDKLSSDISKVEKMADDIYEDISEKHMQIKKVNIHGFVKACEKRVGKVWLKSKFDYHTKELFSQSKSIKKSFKSAKSLDEPPSILNMKSSFAKKASNMLGKSGYKVLNRGVIGSVRDMARETALRLGAIGTVAAVGTVAGVGIMSKLK